jgi:hypothetical protein
LLTSRSIKELYGQKHGLVCPQMIAKGMDPLEVAQSQVQMIAKGMDSLEVARSQVVYRDTMHSECTRLIGYKLMATECYMREACIRLSHQV